MREYFKSKEFKVNKSKPKSKKPKTHKEALAKYAGKNAKPKIDRVRRSEITRLGIRVKRETDRVIESHLRGGDSNYLLSDDELSKE